MQDRYAGDVGDFMKLGLLRALSAEPDPLWLGVNWYLTADECHNADGKHTGYLDPASRHHRSLKNCDPELLCRLSEVVSGHRSVAAIEAARVLPAGSRTFPELLGVAMGDTLRRQWHGRALTRLARADLVFVDPDNGMRARRGPKPNKFAFTDELADYTSRGQSLVVYHHADRSPGGVLAQVPRRLGELAAATRTEPLGAVIARRGSCRFFLIVPAEHHRARLADALDVYAARWRPHVDVIRFDP